VIKCHLSRLMGERKLKISDVARDTGLHRNTITLLYQETANRVDLDAIEVLCRYFGVGVGEMLELQESSADKAAHSTHQG
jgi:putative transcriptional regulator